jgi:signal peptidase I
MAVRRRVVKRKPPIRRKPVEAPRHDELREVASAILIIGILYFGIQGSMFIIFHTDSPMLAVVSGSMVHNNEDWRNYFLQRGYDPSKFPCQGGFARGDLIFVKGVDSINELKIGDVIVYRQIGTNKDIVHRIVNISSDNEITTKGDANGPEDNPSFTFDRVIGKYEFKIPRIGFISLWIRRE